MCLGEAVTHSAAKPLWTCSLLVLPHDNAELAQSWPSELARLYASFHHSLLLLTNGKYPTPDPRRQGCEGCQDMSGTSWTS